MFDADKLQIEGNTSLEVVRPIYSRPPDLRLLAQLEEFDDGGIVHILARDAFIVLPGCSLIHSLFNEFVRGHVSKAQVIDETLQILQNVLESAETSPAQREAVLRLLLRSTARFSALPPSYYIEHVVCTLLEPYRAGGFADVYRATWNHQNVAIKVIRILSSDDCNPLQAAFLREIVLSQHAKHPFIQSFHGVDRGTLAPRLGLVSPWQRNGNIMETMERLIRDNVPLHQICQGLEYLHQMGIAHGDLRGANILVDDNLNPRLADFGLSILADALTRTHDSSRLGLAVRWSSPELLSGVQLRPNFPSDIFAFGCTCIELYGQRKPFGHLANDAQVIFHIARGAQHERPRTGQTMPDNLWKLVEQCLQQDPSQRPVIAEVVHSMEAIVRALDHGAP
ncbi:kinase-like domain-containing protein [Cristinia sonorae]|uniref:Kinase-like domain-containing protein n=1 Tax=Cristinia sonorae TaxID=1940300 RepID=A0A8K0XVJ1_9AGAR|nr:kinase-like domain-containing protein [Cristinia sonorae]